VANRRAETETKEPTIVEKAVERVRAKRDEAPAPGENTELLPSDPAIAVPPIDSARAGGGSLTDDEIAARLDGATHADSDPSFDRKTPGDSDPLLRPLIPRTLGSSTSLVGAALAYRTNVSSPHEALHRAEILGTQSFVRIGYLIAALTIVAVVLLPGDSTATNVFLGAIGVALLSLTYLYHRTKTPVTFHDGNGVAIAWYLPAVACAAAVPFFGPFSPVPVILVLGIYFTSLGKSSRLAFSIYLTCAIVQGTCGTLVILDVMDPGFVHVDYMPLLVQVLCQGLVQVVFLGTYLIARAHRRSQLTALSELEAAVRAIAQREALLEEAREELRRAVGSGRGRFTDQQLGRFVLGDVIGRGAMGEVYEATDMAGNQDVAVKMLSQASLGDAHHVERFLRELKTAASIASPNVVRVIEVGEHPLPHLVMERLRGRDLATILRGKRPMSHDRIVDMIRQVGTGISAAAEAGIVHRDLKPQNLFLAGSTWKILDFGVARVGDSTDTLTKGQVVGTPAYMAPEQARGLAVDHRSDLYALAAIAYRAFTGHAPFSGGEVVDVLYRVVHSAPKKPSSLATLPPDLDLVLAIGLAKNPDDRFSSARELTNALAAAVDGTLDAEIRARAHALVVQGAWAPPLPSTRSVSVL